MKKTRQSAVALPAIIILAGVSCCVDAATPDYPSRPVRMIVPYPPGPGTDVLARVMAQKLTAKWNRSVVVDNRAGAAGTIGADIVAKSAPDGYTLLMGSIGSLGTSKGLYPRLPYDPIKDFAPIMLIARAPSALMVNAQLAAKNVRELINLAKANPGKLNYSSGGSGSTGHLAIETFKHMAGINVVHLPHKGPSQALTALAMNEAQMAIQSQLSALPLIQTNRIRMLATTGTKRLADLPDIPTVAEAGVPGYEFYVWYGVVAPAGTPRNVIMVLNREFKEIFQMPDVRDLLLSQASELAVGTPEEFGAFLEHEVARWTKVIQDIGAHVD
jgi:tripartite-type tricarboxylate transporter receptor subunit TctC